MYSNTRCCTDLRETTLLNRRYFQCLCANCEDEKVQSCEKDSSSKSDNEGFTCNDIYKTTIPLDKTCDGKPTCRNSMTTITLNNNDTFTAYYYEDEYECYKTQLPGKYVDYCTVTPLRYIINAQCCPNHKCKFQKSKCCPKQ